ncbi:hypothetical protein ACJMK2_007272 [Sinanodonta woodiana]|uniref:C1q domain-containing protein n=1 Tax=Sinanodonta woodiana TaxID=1069815 RepID=A0ABD3VL07_SINWO
MTFLVILHLLFAFILYKSADGYESPDSNSNSLQGQLNELVHTMAEYKAKMDRTERMEERLRKAEQSVEKLELSLHLANVQLKNAEKRIELLEKELKTSRQDFEYSDKGENQEIEKRNIHGNGENRQQNENESSINITRKNRLSNLQLEGLELTKAPKNRGSTHDNVAFSVYWSKCGVGNIPLNGGETIPFDIVELNDGNGFDTSMHALICPLTGTYFFTTTVTAWLHKVETEIVVDGISKAVLTTGNPHDENLQSSQSALFRCRQNQRVLVRIWGNGGVGIQCDVGHFTSFSGYLLWVEFTSP